MHLVSWKVVHYIVSQSELGPTVRWSYSFSRALFRLYLADNIFLVLIGQFDCLVIGRFTPLRQLYNKMRMHITPAVLVLAFPFIGSFGKDTVCF